MAFVICVAAATVAAYRPLIDNLLGHTAVDSPPPAYVSALLPGAAVPIQQSVHIPYVGAQHSAYSSVPATSGAHLPWTLEPGIYAEPIADELGVHALEHGHVLVQYDPAIEPATRARLEALGRLYPRDVFIAPYPGLPDPVAATAWGRILRLNHFDPASVIAFIEAFRGRYQHGWRE